MRVIVEGPLGVVAEDGNTYQPGAEFDASKVDMDRHGRRLAPVKAAKVKPVDPEPEAVA